MQQLIEYLHLVTTQFIY